MNRRLRGFKLTDKTESETSLRPMLSSSNTEAASRLQRRRACKFRKTEMKAAVPAPAKLQRLTKAVVPAVQAAYLERNCAAELLLAKIT